MEETGKMKRAKWKRKSGWITPETTVKANRNELINKCLEPQPFYDDWENYRDGMRWNRDRTHLKNKHSYMGKPHENLEKENQKLKRLIKRREAKKESVRNKNVPSLQNPWQC